MWLFPTKFQGTHETDAKANSPLIKEGVQHGERPWDNQDESHAYKLAMNEARLEEKTHHLQLVERQVGEQLTGRALA